MKQSIINKFQLDQIVFFLSKEYSIFGTQKTGNKISFDEIEANQLDIAKTNTIMSFKKALLANPHQISEKTKKIALIGLHNCDLHALSRFIFEFKDTDLMPEQKDIFIIGSSCQPEKSCFCTLMETSKPINYDLYVQKQGNNYEIFCGSSKGEKIFKKFKFKSVKDIKIETIEPQGDKEIDLVKLKRAVGNKKENLDFWQGLANNCFGCGACTAVCPLCFCTRQDFNNDTNGNCHQCLSWDSCFAKRFSEIQNHHDLRPVNTDRLYNWYHHKFVRSFHHSDHPLCTGCGRCIAACPAHLNIRNIINSLLEKNG